MLVTDVRWTAILAQFSVTSSRKQLQKERETATRVVKESDSSGSWSMRNSTSCLGRGAKSWSDWDKGVVGGGDGGASQGTEAEAKWGSGDREAEHGWIYKAGSQKERGTLIQTLMSAMEVQRVKEVVSLPQIHRFRVVLVTLSNMAYCIKFSATNFLSFLFIIHILWGADWHVLEIICDHG